MAMRRSVACLSALLAVIALARTAHTQDKAPAPPANQPSAPPAAQPAPDATPAAPPNAPSADSGTSEAPASGASDASAEVAPAEGAAEIEAAPAAPTLAPASTEPVPSPAELEQRLDEGAPEVFEVHDPWTAPVPVLTLHGYMRVRGELMDTFWLGRRQLSVFLADPDAELQRFQRGQGPDPFSRFRPVERRRVPGDDMAPGDLQPACDAADGCDVDTLQFANMRLRLSPQINVSEDVRVKTTFDIFDNLVAGSGPATYYGAIDPAAEGDPNPTVFAGTDVPPERNNLGDSIVARRAWAEVRNRDLGELRFGRMPQSWGLGMVYNAGDALDQDYSTDLDRLVGVTKLVGLYFSASYDFIAEGFIEPGVADRPDVDQSQIDDVDQFTFSVARKHTQEETQGARERGDAIVDGGLQFQIRNQDAIYRTPAAADASPLIPVAATHYTTDLWGLFHWRWLRVETEFAWVTGTMRDLGTPDLLDKSDISQLGYALETEFRLLDDKLAIYFDHGLATGDADVDGLSPDADYITQIQRGGGTIDDTIATFRFHPSYQVDLILWRNILRQVTGAYYFRPGISYDFVRGSFGQLFGARLDFIWSRASSFVQTWGNDEDLGIELDASLYWRSDDGPDLEDGYHARLHYGVLFPMRGLGYYHEDTDLDTAQTVRLVLGVVF
jgi:uncharacterized protein (TIGR04551 family)